MTTQGATGRRERLEEALSKAVQVLAEKYKPERVVLFGSLATGEVNETSDLDLLIVKETPLPFFERLREVALLCGLDVGADLLVYTPGEVELALRENRFFREEILGKGREVYRAPA
ncbi:MAG: nucleotidyltransferase domain-containing protein [Nitrospirae bacterium]|nr:nucleotidyltransferase domain-containing protein [Nitrospirota bacterium]